MKGPGLTYMACLGHQIAVDGIIDGSATMTFLQAGEAWQVLSLGPGSVHALADGDYYYSAVRIDYRPENVTAGQLRVSYKFN